MGCIMPRTMGNNRHVPLLERRLPLMKNNQNQNQNNNQTQNNNQNQNQNQNNNQNKR